MGARPFEVTNTSSDFVSARLRPSGGLVPTKGIDWTMYLSGCGLRATMLPGCRVETSYVIRTKLDYVGQPETPPVSGSHREVGTPASAGTAVQKPQLLRTASVYN